MVLPSYFFHSVIIDSEISLPCGLVGEAIIGSRRTHPACGKGFIALLVILACGHIFGTPDAAAEFPAKPITSIIPYRPGGSTHLTCRALANAARPLSASRSSAETNRGVGEQRVPVRSCEATRLPEAFYLHIRNLCYNVGTNGKRLNGCPRSVPSLHPNR